MTHPRIYADHAATTPMRDEVVAAMLPYFARVGFNPSSLHAEGRAARAALDDARARVARALGARPREIVFTGGGSESDALAIVGSARAARTGDARHVVTVATEHRAVLGACEALAERGVRVTVLPVDADGRIDRAAFARALAEPTLLASVMLANNEIGTLAPIADLARIAHERGALFHCDAVQAPGRIPLDVETLGVDLLSLTGHKFYGPKGVGVLYVRAGTPIVAPVAGGGQEAGLRAGTENVAGIVGFACALELAVAEITAEAARLGRLRDRFERAVLGAVAGVRINGARAPRLPNLTSLAFADVASQELLARLDLAGAAVSAGSACAAGALEPSHVIRALGGAPEAAAGTVRFSFGKLTSEGDVDRLAHMVAEAVGALREVPFEMGTTSRAR